MILLKCGLWTLILMASEVLELTALLNHNGKTNDINSDVNHQKDNGHMSPYIRLPQFMAIGIKYSFANSWISKSAYILQDRNIFCDEESINKITKCGLRQLFEGLDSRKSLRKSKQSINYSDFFNRNLEAICRQYDTYKQCLRESEVDECTFQDNSIIHILYSHICFEGKQALETSNTGMCLSNLKPSAVIKIAKMTPGCEYCLVDLSSSLSAMLSVFHDHDKDEQNEAVVIKQNLLLICRNWHLLEKCIIPAYGKVCGETAQSFYVSLLNKVKNNLASVYKAYGADIEMIARCNKTTGEAVMSVLRNGSNDEEILNYAQRQRDIFSMSEKEFELRCGQCSPEKTSFTLTACFWSTVYNVGSKWMAMIPQLTHNQKKMCRLLKLFQGCYHDAVSSCPRSSKIDFSDLFQIICDVAQESSMMCFNAISDLSIHQSECGTTLSEITEYYLYKAAVIYEVDQTVCSGSSNIPSMLDRSCLNEHIQNVATKVTGPKDKESCASLILRYLKSLNSVTEQSSVLFSRVRNAICNKTCG